MAAQRQDDEHVQEQGTTGKALKRRGLMAAAAALVVGIAAKQTSQPAVAATGGTQGTALILGANSANGTNNTETQTTIISNNGATYGSFSASDAFYALATSGGTGVVGKSDGGGTGVYGTVYSDTVNARGVLGSAGAGTGVYGISSTGTGVYGESQGNGQSKGVYGKHNANGYAVYGEALASGGYGVTGVSLDQFGVLGTSTSGTGVQGQVTGSAANTVAVKGINSSTGPGGYGVQGISTRSHGVYGEAGNSQGAGGVVGVSRVANGVGFQALAVSPAQYAGFFVGTVSITGSLGVSGGKFAVVKGQDGQYRGMYAVESPECWFEDFGTGTLANGTASIKLDPLFAQHVHADSYHVFVTEHGGYSGLHTTQKAVGGFTVEASETIAKAAGVSKSAVAGTFSWRVVAKRNDIKGERMPVWEMPTTPHMPDPPKVDPSKKA